jgi:hypothetical protein
MGTIMAIYNMFGFDNKLLFYVSVVHWRILISQEIYAMVKKTHHKRDSKVK